ncbi:retrovirus-related pol polyprotein from transposon TNT 1-94 [Tanacetum coccineum]
MHSNICQSNASVLNTKTVNVVNDGSNIVCVSCGKDMFLLSHEKYVARYALSRDSKVKRALFTTPIAAKSKNLGATSIVAKSKLSVAKTPIATNKCSKHMTGNLSLLRNFVKKFMGTVHFGNDHFAAITGYGDYIQGNLTICHNRSIVHTRYNKTPYELIRGRKTNVQYFHVFGYLCYPTNDCDDLGKMKPKADIGIFIGYSESLRGFHIYNGRTKKIMETIHVKFDELTPMDFECNNSGPGINCSNFQDSSEELNEIPSHQDLDNLFGPLYEEYFAPSTFKVFDNSAANTLDVEDTLSSSSITVEDSDASQIVTSSEEPTTQESSTPVLEIHSDEQLQEDVAELDGIQSYILLKHLSSKKQSHLHTIRTHQICTSSINNISTLISGLRII